VISTRLNLFTMMAATAALALILASVFNEWVGFWAAVATALAMSLLAAASFDRRLRRLGEGARRYADGQ
jgi:hypothetical protein